VDRIEKVENAVWTSDDYKGQESKYRLLDLFLYEKEKAVYAVYLVQERGLFDRVLGYKYAVCTVWPVKELPEDSDKYKHIVSSLPPLVNVAADPVPAPFFETRRQLLKLDSILGDVLDKGKLGERYLDYIDFLREMRPMVSGSVGKLYTFFIRWTVNLYEPD